MKSIFLVFFLLFAYGGSASAAICSFNDFTIPVPALKFGSRDGALPQMISETWHEVSGVGLSCSGYLENATYHTLVNNSTFRAWQDFQFEGVNYQRYTTGVRGVEMIMAVADKDGEFIPFTSTEVIARYGTGSDSLSSVGFKFRLRYVATERLAAGSVMLPSIQIMRSGIFFSVDTPGGYYGWGAIRSTASTISVVYPACNLSMPTAVKLPSIYHGKISKVGDTGADTPFNIRLNCPASMFGSNVRYTLTDVSNPGNTSSTLGLLPKAGSAKGVGLQVLEGNAPVSFGADSAVAGNRNQRDFGVLPKEGGTLSKDFVVRYIRTAASISPGEVSAGITITLSYQ